MTHGLRAALLAALAAAACAKTVEVVPPPERPDMRAFGQEVVEVRLRALLAHDLDGVLSAYAPQAELVRPTGEVVARGQAAIRAYYEALLERCPRLQVDLLKRVYGDEARTISDLERIRCGATAERWITHELQDGLIAREVNPPVVPTPGLAPVTP